MSKACHNCIPLKFTIKALTPLQHLLKAAAVALAAAPMQVQAARSPQMPVAAVEGAGTRTALPTLLDFKQQVLGGCVINGRTHILLLVSCQTVQHKQWL